MVGMNGVNTTSAIGWTEVYSGSFANNFVEQGGHRHYVASHDGTDIRLYARYEWYGWARAYSKWDTDKSGNGYTVDPGYSYRVKFSFYADGYIENSGGLLKITYRVYYTDNGEVTIDSEVNTYTRGTFDRTISYTSDIFSFSSPTNVYVEITFEAMAYYLNWEGSMSDFNTGNRHITLNNYVFERYETGSCNPIC